MATPTFTLPTSGSDPKRATKEGLEENINQIIQYLDNARIVGDDRGTEGFYNAGSWDASTGAFPTVRGQGGSVQNGDTFRVSVAGTVDGEDFAVDQRIIAQAENPSSTTYAGNWERANTIAILGPLDESGAVSYSRLTFEDEESFLQNNTVTYENTPVGVTVVERKGGQSWIVADASEINHHTTANGVKYFKSAVSQGPYDVQLSAAYVTTLDTGLITQTPSNVSATLEISVTGSAGSNQLTTTETSKVSGLGGQDKVFAGVLVDENGETTFVDVLGNDGNSLIYLGNKLDRSFTGVLSPKYDVALGQHLSRNATKAFAEHLAKSTGAITARGDITDGVWLDRPSAYYQDVWSLNTATINYGVQNSPAPIVQTKIINQVAGANIISQSDGLPVRPIAKGGRGIIVGTHAAGHGANGSLSLSGDSVIEFWTGAYRGSNTVLTEVEIGISVSVDGVVLYDTSADHKLARHVVHVPTASDAIVSITNNDGGTYYIEVSQLIAREMGRGGKLIPAKSKVLTFGDSYFEFYNGLFASSLSNFTGADVTNRALGGMTTFWALDWFDTYVKGQGYDVVVLHFYTNDSNNLSGLTHTRPDGTQVPRWPSGLAGDEHKDLWRSNIKKLISMIQDEGARPIIMLPGGTASESQMQRHAEWSWHLDKPLPKDFRPVAGELADPTSFLNNFGKKLGVSATSGQGEVFASGSLPSDAWGNPLNDALSSLQKLVLTAADYSAPASFTLGIDDNSDGLSNGVDYLSFGTNEAGGDTYTPSIVNGAQRYTITWSASATGAKRLRFDFNVSAGTEYLAVVDVENGASGEILDVLDNIDTSYVSAPSQQRTLSPTGDGQLYHRRTADSSKTASVAVCTFRSNGNTDLFDVKNVFCVDLAELRIAAPNTATMSDAEIAEFVSGLL